LPCDITLFYYASQSEALKWGSFLGRQSYECNTNLIRFVGIYN
jgi:hypothetical protein